MPSLSGVVHARRALTEPKVCGCDSMLIFKVRQPCFLSIIINTVVMDEAAAGGNERPIEQESGVLKKKRVGVKIATLNLTDTFFHVVLHSICIWRDSL